MEVPLGRFLRFPIQEANFIAAQLGNELKEMDGVDVVGKKSNRAFQKAPLELNLTRAGVQAPWLKVFSIVAPEWYVNFGDL